ncbi:hypothetical protein DUT91_20130 [Phyllobacterium salinisoli]|uniref:Uncharacterized protein n=1 Tax=Phyllobacterium salinisoli TaxID=1899321 RepID=A0A368K229_9HYPH|nr:hypothetical protein [Phyllobacterium salinisoli]RCS22040.1 hypothetical protein DUT91_20130 [Phyllobacterium salinisoli]
MPKPLIFCHSSLVYAWTAGGQALLNKFAAYAKAAGYELVITDGIRRELDSDPQGVELGKWLDARGIKSRTTFEFPKRLKKAGLSTNHYNTAGAGHRSISECAKTTKEADAYREERELIQRTPSVRRLQ